MLFQDIRFGLRTALKNKGVTGLAVTCLAIGIGLNTMMFSVTDGVLIQPLPYQAPRPHRRRSTRRKSQHDMRFGSLSWLELQDWKERARSFSAIAAPCSTAASPSATAAMPIAIPAPRSATSSFRCSARRRSSDADSPPTKIATAASRSCSSPTISGSAATTRIPSIVGRAIQVNSRPHTVIGVMPPQFKFPENQYLWLPLAEFAVSQNRDARGLQVFAPAAATA